MFFVIRVARDKLNSGRYPGKTYIYQVWYFYCTMPKFKDKTINCGSWTLNNLMKALKYVTEEHHSISDSAEKFNIPKTILHRRVMAIQNWFGDTSKAQNWYLKELSTKNTKIYLLLTSKT